MSRTKNQKKQTTKTPLANAEMLGDYVAARMEQKGLSTHAAAAQIGISHSYLADILQGKFVPSIRILRSLAIFFGDPILYVVRLGTGVPIPDADSKALALELEEALENDPVLKEMYDVYASLKTPEEKKAMLKAIKIFVSKED